MGSFASGRPWTWLQSKSIARPHVSSCSLQRNGLEVNKKTLASVLYIFWQLQHCWTVQLQAIYSLTGFQDECVCLLVATVALKARLMHIQTSAWVDLTGAFNTTIAMTTPKVTLRQQHLDIVLER